MSTAPSLYRRHRPRTFADVVGQEHVVRTLRNAVSQGKVHHAYLFVGSRGTGKTSMAKILAACLNCAGTPEKPTTGPTTEPCGVCESCVSIANATSLDVIEMDAASNNSVDDVRDLREKVAFAPVSGRHKVYILDEAHMLSTAAWNAFLKTLEEPPPHTIFVLATTEANKVPATVVDRCHRFDFGRPTVEQLATVVRRVAEREEIEIPPDAVALLARHAAGSFRDALGTLEQLVTYSGRRIELPDVLAVLGVADADLLFGVLDALAAHDPRAVLLMVAQVADSGRDLARFASDVECHARELLIVQTLGEVPPEISVTPERDTRLAEQAGRVAAQDAIRLLDLLAAAMRAVKDGADARTQLELALVKAAAPEVDASSRGLLARLQRLEDALAGAGPAAIPIRQPDSAEASAVPPPARASGRAGSAGTGPRPRRNGGDGDAPVAVAATPAQAAAAPASAAASTAGGASPASPAASTARVAAPSPLAASAAAVPVALSQPAIGLEGLLELWPAVLSSLAETNQVLSLCLADARPVELGADDLVVAFDVGAAFMRRKAEDPRNRAALAETIRALTGLRVRLAFELREGIAAAAANGRSGTPGGAPPTEDELIARFKAEFDAEEIDPAEREDPS